MNEKRVNVTGGIGFFGILALIFITLKLLGKITWSWLWVLAPIWIPALIVGAILVILFIIASAMGRSEPDESNNSLWRRR